MPNLNSVQFRELAVIEAIIRDEMWLEGERRGCRVDAHDPVVQDRVCSIILRIGQQMREAAERALLAAS